MVYSMTGFGRGEAEDELYRITVEIKTVNNRFLDLNIRIPRYMNIFDAAIRELSKKYLNRGKADVFVSVDNVGSKDIDVECNSKLAGKYIESLRAVACEYSLREDISVSLIAKLPEVFSIKEAKPDETELEALLLGAVEKALENLNEARQREGEFLLNDLKLKLDNIRSHLEFIEKKVPEFISSYEEKLRARIEELTGDRQIDESRLLTEVAIFADKSAVDEEIVRLKSHIDAFISAADSENAHSEGVGRKLDFIVQEMNRESNTILSKSPDMEVSEHAVEIKTDIEKIREQIQNIE